MARGRLAKRVDLSASVRRDDTDAFGTADTWNVGAVVDLPEAAARVYVSYGTSFKAPTLSERFSRSAFNVGNASLVPEEGKSWEAGFDVAPLEGDVDLKLGATYFRTSIENLIEYNFGLLRNVNVGKAKIDGYEAYVEYSPIDAVTARLNYTLTDARNGVTNKRLLRRPPNQWSANVTFKPTDALAISADWLLHGDRDDVLYGNTNPFGLGGGFLGNGPAKGYNIVNLAARYRLNERFSVFTSVHNALDKGYEDPNSYAGAPRSVSFGIRGQF
jgi:vitamin B12 transporter